MSHVSAGVIATTECDCPICPLIAYDIQVCDLQIIFPPNPNGNKSLPCGDACFTADLVKSEQLPDGVKTAVAKLIQHVRKNSKPKVGYSTEITFKAATCPKVCTLSVRRKSPRVYEACIHIEDIGQDPC